MGRAVDERRLFISVLTLAEYDKGIANLAGDDPNVQRFIAARDALEARFTARILSLSDPVVRRWGAISGRVKRETGHPPPVIDTLLAATAIEADPIWFPVTRRICSTVEPLSSIHGAMTSPRFR